MIKRQANAEHTGPNATQISAELKHHDSLVEASGTKRQLAVR